MKKRILSLALAAMLLMGMLPAGAAAADITPVQAWNISLGDRIGANFYISVPEEAEQSTVRVTVAGETETVPLSAPDADGLCPVSVQVAAAQMTEQITLQLVADGEAYAPVSYCVRDYARQILEGNYSASTKELIRHMLNYGASAQTYFSVNTQQLANAGYEIDYAPEYPDTQLSGQVSGSINGVYTVGVSLSLESKVCLRYYYSSASLANVTFTAEGESYTPVQKNGMYYVEIPGIMPQDYGAAVTLCAQRGEEKMEVSYSPLTYILRMAENGEADTKALVGALYGYHQAALTYGQQVGGTVILPELSGGAVTADRLDYAIGDTVTLTVTPDDGSCQKLYINGQPLLLNWKTNQYSFVATEPVYRITGSFVPAISAACRDENRWDMANQAHGILRTYYPNNSDAWRVEIAGQYQQFTVSARNYLAGDTGIGGEGYAINIGFKLSNGNEYVFRIILENGRYYYQRFGIGGSDWYTKSLSEAAVAALCGEGVSFQLARTAANQLTLSVDGVVYDTYTMTGATEQTVVTQAILLHYGNQGPMVEIPYSLTEVPGSEDVQFSTAQLSNYTIVYSNSNPDYKTLANQLKSTLSQNYSVSLPVVADSASTPGDYEILLGDTNRDDQKSRVMEYSVTVKEGALRINVGGSCSAANAITYLCDSVFTGQSLSLGVGEYYRTSLLDASRGITSGTTARIMSANMLADAFSSSGFQKAYYRAEIFAGMLVSYKPDVIGMQETDWNWSQALPGYLELLEEVYGICYCTHLINYENKINYTSLLYRSDKFRVDNSGVTPFSWWVDPSMNHSYHMRNITWAQFTSLTDSGDRFVVANTHWSYRTEHANGSTYLSGSSTPIATDQLRQQCKNETNTVMAGLKNQYSAMPVFLTGDFNTSLTYFTRYGWTPSSYSVISQQANSNGTAQATVPSSGHYDHLFGTGSYSVKCFDIIKNVNYHSYLSDHSFVYADLAF